MKVCLMTAPSGEEAHRLARLLLESKKVACVNLVPGVTSLYWWEGKIQEDAEVLLIAKTPDEQVESVIEWIRAHHPYQVAEVLALPVAQGNPPYMAWVDEVAGAVPPRS